MTRPLQTLLRVLLSIGSIAAGVAAAHADEPIRGDLPPKGFESVRFDPRSDSPAHYAAVVNYATIGYRGTEAAFAIQQGILTLYRQEAQSGMWLPIYHSPGFPGSMDLIPREGRVNIIGVAELTTPDERQLVLETTGSGTATLRILEVDPSTDRVSQIAEVDTACPWWPSIVGNTVVMSSPQNNPPPCPPGASVKATLSYDDATKRWNVTPSYLTVNSIPALLRRNNASVAPASPTKGGLIEAAVGKPFTVQLPGMQGERGSWYLDEEATAPALTLVDSGRVVINDRVGSDEYLRFVTSTRGTMLLAVLQRTASNEVARERYYVVVAR
jgi:hypothetical protein